MGIESGYFNEQYKYMSQPSINYRSKINVNSTEEIYKNCFKYTKATNPKTVETMRKSLQIHPHFTVMFFDTFQINIKINFFIRKTKSSSRRRRLIGL